MNRDFKLKLISLSLVERRRTAISVSVSLSVCLSVRSHLLKNTCPNFTKFLLLSIAEAQSSWRKCNLLCTSSFLKVYCVSSYNSTRSTFEKLKFPQIVRCSLYFRLTYKLEYIICGVLITAWIKSMHMMKTPSHYAAFKVKSYFYKRHMAVTFNNDHVKTVFRALLIESCLFTSI